MPRNDTVSGCRCDAARQTRCMRIMQACVSLSQLIYAPRITIRCEASARELLMSMTSERFVYQLTTSATTRICDIGIRDYKSLNRTLSTRVRAVQPAVDMSGQHICYGSTSSLTRIKTCLYVPLLTCSMPSAVWNSVIVVSTPASTPEFCVAMRAAMRAHAAL